MPYFITNSDNKNLGKRIEELIKSSEELKFLVGFFYFSGIQQLYQGLKQNEDVLLKILVGLNVDRMNYGLVEYADDMEKTLAVSTLINRYLNSVKTSLNYDEFDNKEFYEQVRFFIEKIKNDKIIIRKTRRPNHAKLYLFKLKEDQVARRNQFITGSSNLTKSGLTDQDEFNVEISDYGFEVAEEYFDNLWRNSIEITEKETIKRKLIEIIEKETLIQDLTPFEAYCLVLKSYLDTYEIKDVGEYIRQILDKRGYKPYKYQLDAVSQAISIIEKHNGIILADVVGLGKTVIACLIAKQLKKRGVVIAPPGLVGDDNKKAGWKKYLHDFELYDWEARSLGKLEEVLEFVKENNDIEVIIVDEAHRFRNQDTRNYELLKNICRNKNVILLTATPFNNKPADILALLNLFIIPKKSSITLSNDVDYLFAEYKNLFYRLGYIYRYHNSSDMQKQKRAQAYYKTIFGHDVIDLSKVKSRTHWLARQIRDVIEPITIRRNRIDLLKNPAYKDEVNQLSKVKDPKEWFFVLTSKQSNFYDKILTVYFGDPDNGGRFKGAIYRPFIYEEGEISTDENGEFSLAKIEKNREFQQQTNLFHFMRRLLVKRFESSFGAFQQSIKNFKRIHEDILSFITKTGKGNPLRGEYILDRNLLEKISELDLEQIEEQLIEYENLIRKGEKPKKHKRYRIEKFKFKNEFIEDIKSDIQLFTSVLKELDELKLVDNDPKRQCLIENVLKETPHKGEPKRKIIIFSEFLDTVKYLKPHLEKAFNNRVLTIEGELSDRKIEEIYSNFDASYKKKKDDYDILLCTDKISEGFNLNRAGMVVNYDIPWNPVRVIQRLGRINRISKKVFDELYIVNFFPTEQGADYIRSREIAQNKMFMIHNTLGEDAKIFDIDEEPTEAKLYQRLMQNPDEMEQESFYTKALNIFNEIKTNYPDIIEKIENAPPRIKVSRKSDYNELLVFFRKNRLYVVQYDYATNSFEEINLEEILDHIKCTPDEPTRPITERFWTAYEEIKNMKDKKNIPQSELSLTRKALNNLDFLIRSSQELDVDQYKDFLMTLREDILDYGTLSDFTLRRIANWNTNIKSDQQKRRLHEDINELLSELGKDYLQREKMREKDVQKEIIIAIENFPWEGNEI